MKKQFKFSVIIPVYNVEEYLAETMDSVIDQTIGFEDNIQIVLINDGSPDNAEKICLEYKEKYPDNIIYVKQENAGVSAARNKGIELATGEFVNFLDSDDLWSKNAFKQMYNQYKKHPEVTLYSCQMQFFDARKGNHPLNYKYKKNKVVDILTEYEYPQLSSSSIFIKNSVLKKYRYDKNIKYSEDNKMINEIIFDEQKIMMLKKPIYYYRKRATGSSAIQGQTMNIHWYTTTPEKVYRYLFDLSKQKYGRVIEYIQYLIGYELSWRIVFNQKFNISKKEKKKYEEILKDLVKEMDDKLILNHRHLNLAAKIFLFELKGEKDPISKIKYEEDHIIFKDLEIKKKTLGHVIIDQIYTKKNKFEVFGKLDRKYVPEEDFKIISNNKEIKINYYELTNNYNEETFSETNLHDYIGINFILDLNSNWDLGFYYKEEYLVPRFKRSSIFTEYLVRSYHHEGKRTIVLRKNKLYNQKRNLCKSFYYELRNELNLLKRKRWKVWFARINTKIMRLFKRKEIWLISDRVNKADDNGEHFFKYMVENHPEVKTYFILTKESPDYERVSKIGPILDPNENKYKLLFHRCDYVVSSHAENYIFNPLGNNGRFIQDQYHFKYIFLQHGIIKDDLSPWLNVNTKKMDMFVTSSVPEYESLLKYKYYYGPDIVKLTGLPRYDTLLNKQKGIKPKKQIMLSLTWRNSLASVIDKKTGQRMYNEKFKDTEYFKNMNNFMNDERILKVLREKGYTIKFCPHPNVLSQLKDFQENDLVQIENNNINYQKEFCENSLLITDYSSIFFDFGYLKKPIIYFQVDKEEFFEGQLYNEGYFDYEKMGFGPVCDSYEKLVQETINLINRDCQLDEEYEKRIDNFFKFKDQKNCERVYNEITKL